MPETPSAVRPDGLVTVAGTTHRLHAPSTYLDDGRFVTALEVPQRVDTILASVAELGEVVAPRKHPDHQITTVHDPRMLEFLATAYDRWSEEVGTDTVVPDSFGGKTGLDHEYGISVRADAGYYCRDTGSPMVAGTWSAVREGADIALTAAHLVATEQARTAYGLCRPPGHHAARAEFSGFCYLNNAAIAAASLRHLGRVAIVDTDFHHGNGTQEIFWEDPGVIYASLHGDPRRHFPFFCGQAEETGGHRGRGTTINRPLPDGTDGPEYLNALHEVLERVDALRPDVVVLSLGLDTAESDPAGTFSLRLPDFDRVGAAIADLSLPVVAVQEGGYDLPGIGAQVAAVLNGLGRTAARTTNCCQTTETDEGTRHA